MSYDGGYGFYYSRWGTRLQMTMRQGYDGAYYRS